MLPRLIVLSILLLSQAVPTTAEDINQWPCDSSYRYVGRPIFGAVSLPFFGVIHGGDSALDVACHLMRTPGVSVQIESVVKDDVTYFQVPIADVVDNPNQASFVGNLRPIVRFQNFVINGVSLDGEVRFSSAASLNDIKLLDLAQLRLGQGRRLSSFPEYEGFLADSIERIDLWGPKPGNDAEKKKFFKDRKRVAQQLSMMMEENGVSVQHSLADMGSIWFEPSHGLTVSMESKVTRGIEISFKYNFEEDDLRLSM